MTNISPSFISIFALCSVLIFTVPNTAVASELTAAEILARMEKAYASAQTYQDEGLVEVVIRFPERNHTVKKPFTTAFIRPDRFRYEYNEVEPLVKTSKFVIFRNGENVKAYWTLDEGISQLKTTGEALSAAAGVSGGSARTVPTMLMPDESLFGKPILLYFPKRAVDEVIDGADCYRIEDLNDYRDLTLWIDKEEFLLRKMYWEQDEKNSIITATTTYSPILNGTVARELLGFGVTPE